MCRTRRWLAAWLIVVGLPVVIGLAWLRSGLFQEPFGTLIQAAKLEVRSSSVSFTENGNDPWVLKSGGDGMSELIDQLETDGWTYREQLGAGHLLERDTERTVMICDMYSTRFMICSLNGR